MYPFTDRTLSLLKRAGWTEDYRKNTEDYKSLLVSEGYVVHPSALDFLSRFGGLHVTHPHFKIPDEEDSFHFDPIEAVDNWFNETLLHNGQRIGAKVCVIGECCRGYLALLMTPEGSVYAGSDCYLARAGESGMDAIEAMCSGRPFVDLPYPSADKLPMPSPTSHP